MNIHQTQTCPQYTKNLKKWFQDHPKKFKCILKWPGSDIWEKSACATTLTPRLAFVAQTPRFRYRNQKNDMATSVNKNTSVGPKCPNISPKEVLESIWNRYNPRWTPQSPFFRSHMSLIAPWPPSVPKGRHQTSEMIILGNLNYNISIPNHNSVQK